MCNMNRFGTNKIYIKEQHLYKCFERHRCICNIKITPYNRMPFSRKDLIEYKPLKAEYVYVACYNRKKKTDNLSFTFDIFEMFQSFELIAKGKHMKFNILNACALFHTQQSVKLLESLVF